MSEKKTTVESKTVKAKPSKKSVVKNSVPEKQKKVPTYERQLTAEGWKRIMLKISE